MRTVPEWIGKTADSAVPPRVKLRVFERLNGTCHISGIKIQTGDKWQVEHVIPLILWTGDGHGNRETNLAPALVDPHKEKTKAEMKIKAKVARTRKKHIRVVEAKQSIQSAPFARSEKAARKAERAPKPQPPRRALYQEM